MANIEFIIPSVLNKGTGEKKVSLEAHDLHEAFAKVSDILGDDFKRRVFDLNGKPRALINIYINGRNMRFSSDGMATPLKDGDSLYKLAAMGVGKLKIVDRDVVEISNLHRQHLYNEDDIGKVKVEVAAERLKKINPHVEIEAIPLSITKYTAESIVKGMDIIIDALDSVDARYALNDACIKYNIPFIYAGALGMLGSVCTILPNKSACLRCMFPALAEEDMPTCSTEGVHPSILYLVAGVQVSEAVKIVTGQHPTLVNKLLYIDLNELSFDKIQMFRHEECSSCGPKKESKKEVILQQEELIIEELCGRDRGKRTYTVSPSSTVPASISLTGIVKNAESLGYDVKMKGNLGITAISTNPNKLSISFLTSGAATIVGAKDEEDALFIYRTFAKEIK